jgi:hypothetical protein
MGWHVECTGETRNAHKIFVGKTREYFEDIGTGVRIISKGTLDK